MARKKDHSAVVIILIIVFYAVSAAWKWAKETARVVFAWVVFHEALIIGIVGLVVVLFIALIVGSVRYDNHRKIEEAEALEKKRLEEAKALENKRNARLLRLREKYRDEQVVQNIFNNTFWIGATHEMLIDAMGEPEEKDVEVMKRKTKETWKYGHKQGNQYRLRIYLENSRISGWEDKG